MSGLVVTGSATTTNRQMGTAVMDSDSAMQLLAGRAGATLLALRFGLALLSLTKDPVHLYCPSGIYMGTRRTMGLGCCLQSRHCPWGRGSDPRSVRWNEAPLDMQAPRSGQQEAPCGHSKPWAVLDP